jgi:hypothetical protein
MAVVGFALIAGATDQKEIEKCFPVSPDMMPFEIVKLPQNLPENLKLILGLKPGNMAYLPRLKAVHHLRKNLTPTEIQALLWFLHKKIKDDKLKNLDFNAIKNEVVIALMSQEMPVHELPQHLIAMFNSKDMDKIWRDYCVQFLGQLYPKIPDEESRLQAKQVFVSALGDKRFLAGTALISMDLAGNCKEIKKSEIIEHAYNLCIDKDASDIVKTTALQICAKHHDNKTLPVAKDILKSKASSVPLKMSAIAAIGMLGNGSEVAMLEKYRLSSDVRLRKSAKAAIKKLSAN